MDAGEDSIESAEREFEEETDLYCEKDDIFSLGFVTPDAGYLLRGLICLWQLNVGE